jgi:hypothetical protein
VSYILSVNIARRHMSKSQRAMAVAMAYPEAKHGGARQKGSSLETKLEFSSALLSQARAVLAHSRALAEAVLARSESLAAAYEKVRADQEGERVSVAEVKTAVAASADARDDDPPPRPRHRPQAENITPSISKQLVANAHEHLDAIVSLMRKMAQHDRASFQQTAMERLGGDQ